MDQARPSDHERSIEQRTSDLQLQFEHVSLALQQLRQTQESLHGMEQRLSDMTSECSGILDRWEANDQKHATAVAELHSRLSEWNDIERRLLNESTTRIHQFERNLQHEWVAIRQSHEEPIRQLDAQTTRITEACLTAVDQALQGFGRAEARVTALEQQFQQEMGALLGEVREALAELRQGAPQIGGRQPWAIDNVVRLHGELREESDPEEAEAPSWREGAPRLDSPWRDLRPEASLQASATPSARPETPRDDASGPAETPSADDEAVRLERVPVWRRTPVVAAAVLALVLGAFGLYLQTEVRQGLLDAAARAEAAERGARETRDQARREISAMQQAADRRLEEAQKSAQAARSLASIAAAPDLFRLELANRSRELSAHVLWSRAEGVALSASRLPQPPEGKAYQLWLLTPGGATSVGPIDIDANGGANAQFGPVPNLPVPVVGAILTVEAAGEATRPTGPPLLSSAAGRPRAQGS
jgi:Anti-sigma-K factor rskA, C-terminal